MSIEVNLDRMLEQRNMKSNKLNCAIGIITANL